MLADIRPQWVAKMYPSKVGRDHLGLGSVSSDQILPSLSPSINVLTFHPRYYSFYAFLLDEFWRRDRPRSRASWTAFYRPREFVFSVGANLPGHIDDRPEHGDMGNIVGSSITTGLARREQPAYDVQTYYIKTPLGGYGLYYRTVMAELGLILPGGPGFPYPVDVPSEERGKEVAAAFREAIEGTRYYREYFDDDAAEVPTDIIKSYMAQACLCQLQHPAAPDRARVLDVFLHGGSNREAEARRATLRLFLDIASQTDGYVIDQDTFRQLIFFKSAENGCTLTPHDSMEDTFKRWRLYQAREYYAFALNALWYHLCDWGLAQHGDIRPIALSKFWRYLDQALDFDRLASALQITSPKISGDSGFTTLLRWLESTVDASGLAFDAACGLSSPIHEHRLYRLALERPTEPEVMVAGMITMLALTHLRFGLSERWKEPEWQISLMGANGRLSVNGFVRQMQRRLSSGPVTIAEIARWLYNDYVILQHQAIAAQKLPDNTFRFRREGDRLYFFNLSNTLGFMDSRFDALKTMVHELGLCGNMSQSQHALTPDGRCLLNEGDLP